MEKNMKIIIPLVFSCFILSGCLTYQEYSFKFDYDSGITEIIYRDLRSKKAPDEDDYSIENDWLTLLKMTNEEFGKEFDHDVIRPIKAELFQEDNKLSGKQIFKIRLPKAFPSKTAIFERIHADGVVDGLKFQILNEEIFLFAYGKKIKSANGKIINTSKNNIIVWPKDQTKFDFTIDEINPGGTSLLPFYLEEKKLSERDKSTQ